MPVQTSNSKSSAHLDLAANLLQILLPTTFHSLLCHLKGIYTSAMLVCKELFGYYPPKVEIENTLQEFLPVQKRGSQETVCPKDNQNGSWLSPWSQGMGSKLLLNLSGNQVIDQTFIVITNNGSKFNQGITVVTQ